MKLTAILTAERVATEVTVTSKKKALEELSKLLAKGTDKLSSTDIFNGLTAREKLGSTGLGHGVAIPHGRMSGITNSVGAFIRLKHPVDYDAHDGQPVDLVFGLVVPVAATEEHLKHLAAIAEKFSEEDFCQKMRAGKDDAALYGLLVA
ncbi:MAG TPA: PTS IIA-like nitrogen regulatory protein PtsN [Verrucomicrobiae bacterium]|nr:PTS IIA-like nitrogen regulatory protein PtsN [Verrucomicrobiae bacterium]